MPLVSVVMPCFNYARYLEESVKSILDSTEQNFELIIVDDGSGDGSRELIARLAQEDRRIKPLYHETNLGASASRNDGLNLAEGEYIAFCDADDKWLPHKLEKQLTLLAAHPEADIVYSNARIIDEGGRETGALFNDRFPVPGTGGGNLFTILCVRNFINMQSALFRRSALREVEKPYFDPEMWWVEDWLFWIKLARTGSFLYCPEPLCLYRVHSKNTATLQPEGVTRNRIKVYLEVLKFAESLPRQVVSEIFYHLGVGLSHLKGSEEEKKAFYTYSVKRAYFHALQINPLNVKAFIRLLLSYAPSRT